MKNTIHNHWACLQAYHSTYVVDELSLEEADWHQHEEMIHDEGVRISQARHDASGHRQALVTHRAGASRIDIKVSMHETLAV